MQMRGSWILWIKPKIFIFIFILNAMRSHWRVSGKSIYIFNRQNTKQYVTSVIQQMGMVQSWDFNVIHKDK